MYLNSDNWFAIFITYNCTRIITEAGINQAHRALMAKYIDQILKIQVVIQVVKNVRSHIVHCFFLIFIHHVRVSLNLLNSYGNDANINTLKLFMIESDNSHVVFEFSSFAFISYFLVILKNITCSTEYTAINAKNMSHIFTLCLITMKHVIGIDITIFNIWNTNISTTVSYDPANLPIFLINDPDKLSEKNLYECLCMFWKHSS